MNEVSEGHLSQCPLSIEVFNGHCFERFAKANEIGTFYCYHKVDGIEVSEQSWKEQRYKALLHDMMALNIKPPLTEN